MRVLFAAFPGMWGHVYPYISVIRNLQSRGHDVFWSCLHDNDGNQPVPSAVQLVPCFHPIPELPGTTTDLLALLLDPVRFGKFFRKWPTSQHFADEIERIGTALRSLRPDVAVVDSSCFHVVIALERAGIPYVAAGPGLQLLHPTDFQDPLARADPEIERDIEADLRARWGFEGRLRGRHLLSPHSNVVFTTQEFVADHPNPDRVTLAGPSIPPTSPFGDVAFPWQELRKDGRVVYAGFGTMLGDQRVFRLIARAVADLDAQLVLSLAGFEDPNQIGSLPGDVLATPFVPQLELLDRVAVYVTHGGANSVMEALYQGVPMLVVPFNLDQYLQAHFIERLGPGSPGLTIDSAVLANLADQDAVARIRSAIDVLLEPNGSHAVAANHLRGSYRQHDGAIACADSVEQLGRLARSRTNTLRGT